MNKYQSNISYSKLLENIKCLLLKISFLDFSTKLQIRVEWTDIIVIPSTDDKNGHGSQNVRSLTVHPPLTWLLAWESLTEFSHHFKALDFVELYSFSLLLQAGMVYTKWVCKEAQ